MKKRVPLWAVILTAFVCLALGMLSMYLANDDNPISQSGGNKIINENSAVKISEEEARKIALDKAGLTEQDVVFERTEKDYENGILVYEIEFRKGRTEYSAEISTIDGKIISWEIDND